MYCMKESDLSSYSEDSEELDPPIPESQGKPQPRKDVISESQNNMNQNIKDANEFVEIDLSNVNQSVNVQCDSSETTKRQYEKECCNPRLCMRSCGEKIKSFYCGHNMSYFGCVLTRGWIPGVFWFVLCALISGIVWGVKGGTDGMIVGIVFLILAIIGPILFVTFSACYAHYYPSNSVGSKGCCPWLDCC